MRSNYPFRTSWFYNFEQLPRFCTKTEDRRAAVQKWIKNVLSPPKKINRGHETEKRWTYMYFSKNTIRTQSYIFCSSLADFSESVLKNKKRKNVSSVKHNQLPLTTSSAVAERPRDASCLSVVNFVASIVQYAKRILLLLVTSASDSPPLRTVKRCSVLFGVTLSLPVINTSSSSPAINKLCHLLPAMSVTTCHSPAAPY